MRRLLKVALPAIVAVGTVLAVGTSAQAADGVTNGGGWSTVEWDTSNGYCSAMAQIDYSTLMATGTFENASSGWSCTSWLERSSDEGASWSTVSGVHDVAQNTTVTTDAYGDGTGLLVRACFHFDFSGAATHCSDGV
jgi:hypothetical protein